MNEPELPRRVFCGALLALLGACAVKTTTTNKGSPTMSHFSIDLEKYPNLQFRLDSFTIPDAARAEFEAAMQRNITFLKTLPGFLGHVVFEKTGGNSVFNLATIAAWESPEVVAKAREKVKAYYQEIGFHMPAKLAEWGVKAELGDYQAPARLQ